jgi:hypothetical protein
MLLGADVSTVQSGPGQARRVLGRVRDSADVVLRGVVVPVGLWQLAAG